MEGASLVAIFFIAIVSLMARNARRFSRGTQEGAVVGFTRPPMEVGWSSRVEACASNVARRRLFQRRARPNISLFGRSCAKGQFFPSVVATAGQQRERGLH